MASTPLPVALNNVDRDYLLTLHKIQQSLVLWIIGPIIVFGVAGNVLSIMTLRAKPFRMFQSTFLLIALSCCDIGVLMTDAMLEWINKASGEHADLSRASSGSCKLVYYVGPLMIWASAWTLVLITMERLVSVVRPDKVHLFSSGRIRIGWGVMVGLLTIFSLPRMILFDIHEFHRYNPGTNTTIVEKHCDYSPKHINLMSKYDFWSDLLVGSVIPCLLIFSFNVVIIKRLSGPYRQVSEPATTVPQPTNKTSSITTMLIVVSFVFLVCTLPVRLYQVGYQSWWDDLDTDPIQSEKEHLTYSCLSILYYVNNAINFILYVVINPTFRKEFLRILRCRKVEERGETEIDMDEAIANKETGGLASYGVADVY